MPDAFEILRADHAEVEQMLAALETSPGHSAGAGSTVVAARKEIAQRLVRDSSRHEAAEEEYFWPTVRARLADGDTLADQAIAQEQEARDALRRLDKLDADQDEFDEVVAAIIPAARRHIEFEETHVWPVLRDALATADARELGEKLATAKKRRPTRPQHPRTPASPACSRPRARPAPALPAAEIRPLRPGLGGKWR